MSHKLNLRHVNGSYAIARLEAGFGRRTGF